jgi:hypothetical protein
VSKLITAKNPKNPFEVGIVSELQAYTIAVSGEGLKQPNPIVSYNIRLTLPSGESMAIVDSFPVTPEKDGSFRKTIEGTWKTFEFTLTDKYTLSGTALLASDLNLLHTIPLGFSPKSLNCAAHAARAPVRRDFYEFPRLEMVAGVPSNLVR